MLGLTTLPFLLPLLALLAGPPPAHAALQHRPIPAQPQDPFAVPKFEVAFLNHRPVGEHEAERWRAGGWLGDGEAAWEAAWEGRVEGGQEGGIEELERSRKTIGDTDAGAGGSGRRPGPNVVQLRLPNPSASNSSLDTYLCLVPSPAEAAPPPPPPPTSSSGTGPNKPNGPSDPAAADSHAAATAIGWRSLAHLEGRCLYTRQGWFSYSYCHNSHVRQFREAPHAHPHPPGGVVPDEDNEFQAYNLGLSPALVKKHQAGAPAGRSSASAGGQPPAPGPDSDSDPTSAPPASLSVSRNAHARYLTQTWGAGTTCDKTGRPRRVEVQFHCKMGGIDHIGFIKEVATCKYVLVVYTPNLCSLPGFSSPTPQDAPIHPVQCRRVVPDDELAPLFAALQDELDADEAEHAAYHAVQRAGIAPPADRPDADADAQAVEAQVRAAVEERLVSGDRAPRGYYPAHPLDREIEDAAPGWGGETLLASDNLDEVVAAVLHDFNLDAGAGAAAPEAIEVEIDGATYRIDLAAAQDPAPPAEREARVPKLRNQLKGLNGDLQEQAQRIRTMRERIMARREADTGFAEDEEKEDASGKKLANNGNAQEGRARAGARGDRIEL